MFAINQHQKHQDSAHSSLVIKVFALFIKLSKSQKYHNVRKTVYLIREHARTKVKTSFDLSCIAQSLDIKLMSVCVTVRKLQRRTRKIREKLCSKM